MVFYFGDLYFYPVEKFSQRLALFTSYVFHPLFMPINGLLLTYFFGRVPGFNSYSTDLDKEIAHKALWSVFIATGILPVIFSVILKAMGIVSSLHMPKKEERMLPFLLTGSLYYAVIYLFTSYWKLPLHPLIYQFMFGATLAILIGMMITYRWKISVHMIGIGGVVGITTILSKHGEVLIGLLSITLFIAGLIAFGRLQLKAHSIKQIIAGFLLGFSCEMLGLLIAS